MGKFIKYIIIIMEVIIIVGEILTTEIEEDITTQIIPIQT